MHDALVQGDRLAARYTLHATMRKGQVLSTKVHMFGRPAPDGRISRVDPTHPHTARRVADDR